jgi:uncharacterized protein
MTMFSASHVSAIRACLLIIVCGLFLSASAASQVPVPALHQHVTDLSATLSASEMQHLEAQLTALETRKGSQFMIVMLPTTQPQDIESFSLAIAEKNKIGREKPDDGLLLLVAKDDRKARIEVGRGLEGAIPDVIASRIIREYLGPKFRQNDYAGGLNDASDVIVKIIDGEPLPEPLTSENSSGNFSWVLAFFMGVFVGLFSSGIPIRPVFIRRVLAACAAGFFAYTLFSMGLAMLIAAVMAFFVSGDNKTGRYVSHGGGGFGGWSGGSSGSSSSGGWSGGGGSFGGGGASGGW